MTTLDLFAPAARAWSPQQRAVFDAVAFDTGHLLVRARAGTGKTTTIVEALNRAPRGARVLLCAFNKSIAEELQGRAPKGVEVCTLHSLGYRALLRHWPGAKVDKLRDRRIAERVLGPRHAKHWHDFGQVVSLCKARLELDPARIERAGRSVALLSYNCVGPEASWATPARAGCNYLRVETADGSPIAPAAPLTSTVSPGWGSQTSNRPK